MRALEYLLRGVAAAGAMVVWLAGLYGLVMSVGPEPDAFETMCLFLLMAGPAGVLGWVSVGRFCK